MGQDGGIGWSVVIPAYNCDQPGSKVSVLTDGPRMLWQILSARLALAKRRQGR